MISPESFEPVEETISDVEVPTVERKDPNSESQEEGNVQKLWKKYRWMGEPPFSGSPVENRLRETCKRYMKHVLGKVASPELTNIQGRGDSENYFAQFKKTTKDSSGASRRELHNQIALMVLGKQRSGMDEDLAIRIAEFASEVAFNRSVADALAAVERGEL